MERSIGAQLKQIRESQGIALESIALKTRISLDYLRALEADDIESLPSKAQMRGFLRLYAHELGVNIDDLSVEGYHLAEVKETPAPTEISDQPEDDQQPLSEAPETFAVPESAPELSPADGQVSIEASPPPITFEPDTSPIPAEQKSSPFIFKTIGEKIRSRRELLSLSITEVYNNLHIPPQHLESIEAGEFNQLPSPVQARGLLMNYADFLNLDTDALLSDYTDALQLQRIEKQNAQPTNKRRSARELSPTALRFKNFLTLDLLVISVLFIAIAAFVIWGVNRILSSDQPELSEGSIPGVSDVLLATDTPTPQLSPDSETTLIIQEEEVEEDQNTETVEEPLFTPVVSTDPINIILIPRQRLWVQVTIDGELEFQGRLIPGNAYEYSGQDTIDILTGNIGSLQILFNNQDIGSQGLLGQVAALSFTDSGLVLPPPTSTPTITRTPESTPTPTESND